MRSNSVKALIALALFGLTSAVSPAFAAAPRSRQRTVTKQSARRVTKAKPAKKSGEPAATAIKIQGRENVFHGLDRDGNGSISREEWPAKRREFDVLDRNRDGRLSLAELRSREL